MQNSKIIVLFGKILNKYRESERACIYEGISGRNVTEDKALANLEVEVFNYMEEILEILKNTE